MRHTRRRKTPLARGLVSDWQNNLEDLGLHYAVATSHNMKRLCGDYVDLWDRFNELRQQHADLRERMTRTEDKVEKMFTDLLAAFEGAATDQRGVLEAFRKERVTP